jgi:hypothetical protein
VSHQSLIPLFSSVGRHLGLRPVAALERLAARGAVTLERHRKGHIVCARVIAKAAPDSPPSPLPPRAYLGTKYTYREHLAEQHSVIDLKRLNGARGGLNYAPAEVRPIFLQVVLDCLARHAAPCASR